MSCFSSKEKSQTGGLLYEIGRQSLASDLISASLLMARLVSLKELNVRNKLNIAFWTKKDALVHCD